MAQLALAIVYCAFRRNVILRYDNTVDLISDLLEIKNLMTRGRCGRT